MCFISPLLMISFYSFFSFLLSIESINSNDFFMKSTKAGFVFEHDVFYLNQLVSLFKTS